MIKLFFFKIIYYLGRIWSSLYPPFISSKLCKLKERFYSAWLAKEFNTFGRNSIVKPYILLIGGKYITIGDKCIIGCRATLTAWDRFGEDQFTPQIKLGENVSIGDDSHITAINRIEIGNNVLTGKKITITDNSHGKTNMSIMTLSPQERPLYSEGPVIINEGVWIGDKVTILPNVTIGKNSIIGANAVVTRDIPANCVAAGNPARIIKKILVYDKN